MKIIKLTKSNLSETVKLSAEILKSGGLIILPFDTVYGIVCDAANETAVKKIYALKERSFNKPLGIVIPHYSAIEKQIDLSKSARDFIDERVPGRFTFIVHLKDTDFISAYCQKNDAVAIRIPDSEFIYSLSLDFGKPLAQTSANRAGNSDIAGPSGLAAQFTVSQLSSVDLIIDGGEISHPLPSTIFDLTEETPKKIERG